jgi:signal transduction histidine kinase
MLYEFLISERAAILEECKEHAVKTLDPRQGSEMIEKGWPIFYDHLVEVLRRDTSAKGALQPIPDLGHAQNAARNWGKEFLRVGYPIGELVHSYGTICQSITGAADNRDYKVTVKEFRQLNLCLDIAVAEAVTEFQELQLASVNRTEVERLGFLAHELRNSLMGATLSLQMIQSGDVGLRSATSSILSASLVRMKELIDTSLTEVRLRIEPVAYLKPVFISEIIDEVAVIAVTEAQKYNISLIVEPMEKIEVNVDRQLVISALANLVQNAVKFSKPSGTIKIRAIEKEERVLLEVEDECGGLPDEKIAKLFVPFSQMDRDRTGVGLGLTISRRAVALNHGKLCAFNLPGKGCVFVIDLPTALPIA